MKFKVSPPMLPALALPLLTVSAFGQTVGTAHPEQLNDPITVTPAQTDHYVKPSHAVSSAPNAYTVAPPATAPAINTYPTSYPATGPAPEASYPATAPTNGAAPTLGIEAAAAGEAPTAIDPGAQAIGAQAVDAQALGTQAPGAQDSSRQGSRWGGTDASAAPAPIVRRPLPATAPTGGVPPTSYRPSAAAREEADSVPASGNDNNNDNGIVLEVPTRPHELNSGTVLRARLETRVSTKSTAVGAPFSAALLADAGHSGEVLLPAGSVLRGHVTAVHGGKRIGGQASIRLQPETVTLPDGSIYALRATVSDVESLDETHVNNEGVIQPKTHPKATAAILGGTTATAAITGAVIGGGVGAAVGACIGAGVGTVWWLKRDHQEILPAGTTLFFSLDEPLHVR